MGFIPLVHRPEEQEPEKLIPLKNDSLLLKDVTMAELFKMAGLYHGRFW